MWIFTFWIRTEFHGRIGSTGSELAQKGTKVIQRGSELAQKDGERKKCSERVAVLLDAALPTTLRRDARAHAQQILEVIALNNTASIVEIHNKTGLPERTIKNAQSLLRSVGILHRVGGNRGGQWMISWKDGGSDNG